MTWIKTFKNFFLMKIYSNNLGDKWQTGDGLLNAYWEWLSWWLYGFESDISQKYKMDDISKGVSDTL
jgi:hypothetical protein